MSTERDQSAIKEVRDQLSLDYSDAEYLNAISSNLGLTRPKFGFTDDTWRALVKTLALQYKQIRQKFRDVLEVIFGPQVTQVGTLSQDAEAGDRVIYLNDASTFPQVGTLVLDEGQVAEETVEYCFVDRKTNAVYLDTVLTNSHSAVEEDAESPLVFNASAGATELYLGRSIYFPSSFPVTLVLGRGTANEEVVSITANDSDIGKITVSPALTNSHVGMTPTSIQSELSQAYVVTSEYIVLTDTSKFPTNGYVRLANSTNNFTATGGTVNTVTVAAGDVTTDRHVGNVVTFAGNITAALAGVQARVIANSSSELTFLDTLPAVPAAGDTFKISVKARYTRNSTTDNSLQLSRDIADVSLASGLEVEVLKENSTAAVAPVKVPSVEWDVIQVDPRHIEILIPPDAQDVNNLLSASYLHPPLQSVAATVTTTATVAGDSEIDVTSGSALGWPIAGQLVMDSGGANEESLGYHKTLLNLVYDSTGSTTSLLSFTGTLPAGQVGNRVYIIDSSTGLSTSRIITVQNPTSVEFTDPLTNEQFASLQDGSSTLRVYSASGITVPEGLVNVHGIGTTVTYEETAHAGTTLQDGSLWSLDHVFPGPYLYQIGEDAPTAANASTALTSILSGPTELMIDQVFGKTALEVRDAVAFPLTTNFTAILGRDTGNRETINVTDVNLRQRSATTVAANSLIGDTSLTVAALTGGGTADDFPNANGYRVIVDRGGANEEVIYVTGTAGGPARLLTDPMTVAHSIGETVELMADVLTVDPLDDDHLGRVSLFQKTERWAPVGDTTTLTAAVAVGDSLLYVNSTTGFSSVGKLRIGLEEHQYSKINSTTLSVLTLGGLRTGFSVGATVSELESQRTGEKLEPQYTEISVGSTTGFSASGGTLLLNYGRGIVETDGKVASTVAIGATTITLDSSASFPTSYPYEIVIGEGTPFEEYALVTNNNTGANQLTINSAAHGTQFSHAIGVKVSLKTGPQESLDYTSLTATTFRFSTPIVLKSTHAVPETIIPSNTSSSPRSSGYDFPFRMPTDILFRIEFLFDLIRAAGVRVTVIEAR